MKPFQWYMVTLTAAFVVLDVTHEIDWSWWQITLPLLIGTASMLLGGLLSAMPEAKGSQDRQ